MSNSTKSLADFNRERSEELKKIIKPLELYMNKYCCPHDILIVTQGRAELFSGELSILLEIPD
jgi:hypothetical protein